VVVTDFADVLQIRDIDAIVLLTPDRTQRQQLPMILAARKHCYFSSSAITSVEDAEKLRSAAGSVQRVFFPASHQPLPQASIPVKWSALRLGTVREIRLNLETPLNTAHFDRHNFFSKVIPDLALISAFLNPNAPVAAQALLGPNGRKDIVTLQYQIGRSDCPPPHWLKLTVCDGPIVHSRIGFYGDRGRLEIANEDRHPALDPQMRAFLSAIRSVDQDLTSLLLLGRGWKLAEIGRRAIAAHGRAVLFN
jgi:predicted dehydrogenase